jgi:hypothetical protein
VQAATKRDDGGATQSLELQERFYARPADIFEVRKWRPVIYTCRQAAWSATAPPRWQPSHILSFNSRWHRSFRRGAQELDPSEHAALHPALVQALTDERRLRAFTQSEATSQPQPGGAFSMYGGSVQVRACTTQGFRPFSNGPAPEMQQHSQH